LPRRLANTLVVASIYWQAITILAQYLP
jgi:hypothetical protein